jgi:hypothetical protein
LGTAFVDYTRCIAFLADNRAALLAAAEGASTKVLSPAPEYALAHHCLGCVQVASNRASQGMAECERSLAPDRIWLALTESAKYFVGRREEVETRVKEALPGQDWPISPFRNVLRVRS